MPRRLLMLATLLAVTTGGSACGDGTGSSPSAVPPASSPGSSPSSAAPAASPASAVAARPSASSPAVLADGRHPVYLTRLDTAARRLTFDLVQFLTGEAARKAWAERHPEDPEGPPNDYFIVNDNPRLRTLPVSGGVRVMVVDSGASGGVRTVPLAFDDLPGYLSRDPVTTDKFLWPSPFWLTVEGGEITAIEEQFLP